MMNITPSSSLNVERSAARGSHVPAHSLRQSVLLLGPQDQLKLRGLTSLNPVRFGSGASPLAGTKGLWLTVEMYHPSMPDDLKKGGVGQVSGVIPWQLRDRGMDIRPIFPMYKGMDKVGFESTGLKVTVPGPEGAQEEYELFWKNIDGVVSYAIANDEFAKHKDLYYSDDPKAKPDPRGGYYNTSGASPVNKGIFKFNQAVAAFAPLLDETKAPNAAPPWKFRNGADLNIFNDWLSGVALSELKENNPDYFNKTANVFYVHNTYDYPAGSHQLSNAERMGVTIPQEVADEHAKAETPAPSNWFTQWLEQLTGREKAAGKGTLDKNAHAFSPLGWGMRYADSLIMNKRFMETVLNTSFSSEVWGDAYFKKFLQAKLNDGRVFDMHHAIGPQYNPANSEFLNADGFTQLNPDVKPSGQAQLAQQVKKLVNLLLFFLPAEKRLPVLDAPALQRQARIDELNRFKAVNKQAAQKMAGLPQDPKATLYMTLFRIEDMNQKGSLLVLQTLSKFLNENPHAQIALCGNAGLDRPIPPLIKNYLAGLKADPKIADRVALMGFANQKTSMRLLSGADFMVTPSVYEPYGLIHLEGMAFGTVPVTAPRDGIFATVHDPHVLPPYHADPSTDRRKAGYGQTGIFVDMPDDGIEYFHALKNPNHQPTHPVIRRQNIQFLKAMNRAQQTADSGQLREIAINGMDYVKAEHNRDVIGELYDEPLLDALKQRDKRLADSTTSAASAAG